MSEARLLFAATLLGLSSPVLAQEDLYPRPNGFQGDAPTVDGEEPTVAVSRGRSVGIGSAGAPVSRKIPSPDEGAEQKSDFTFVLSPYLWFPVVDGTVGGTEPGAVSFRIDTGDLLEAYEFGGLVHGEVRHKSGWGISVDYMFADLATTNDIGVVLDTTVDADILEVTVLRRIDLGRNSLDVYGGFRRWDSEVVIDVDTGAFPLQILTGDTWTDPLVGGRYQHALSRRWKLRVQGDIGGFGIDSDLAWHAVAGVSYATSERTSLELAYKRLTVERLSPRIGGGPPVDLDLTVQGPLIGFAWAF